ncbi:MAG: hypothetical protein HKN76_23070 [Saprospiraceae bacterium]|nr:hypothetical protein [Saprospiraceae bacterium]
MIVLIPKCSFCLAAFSGAIALCSGTVIAADLPNWGLWILVLSGFLVLAGLFLNNQGIKTHIAVILALAGIGLISLCQILTLQLSYHYLGSFLILLAIWTNGSLHTVVCDLRQKLITIYH